MHKHVGALEATANLNLLLLLCGVNMSVGVIRFDNQLGLPTLAYLAQGERSTILDQEGCSMVSSLNTEGACH